MSNDKNNGFRDIALKSVEDGEHTVETLERKLEFIKTKARKPENFQDMREGIEAALKILKSNKVA